MARGWESKAVQEQIEVRNETRAIAASKETERQQRARKEGLLLSRSRVMRDLESVRDERYRELLERSLAHLEAELAQLDRSKSP